MKRIVFFVLWIIPVLQPSAWGTIEIFVGGHQYDSMEAYQASKKIAAMASITKQGALNNQQEDYIREETQKLGFQVDFSKIKTFQFDQHKLSDIAQHKLYVLSVEHGVASALKDFYQAWERPVSWMTAGVYPDQLQKVIQQAVTTSKDPKLLIVQPGKMRIMALTPGNSN